MLENLRYAVRQLFRAPTFTIVTILTLALGVGANTAIFSVIQAVLLHPSGVQDPERVASFHAKIYAIEPAEHRCVCAGFSGCAVDAWAGGHGCDGAGASFNATFDGRTQHLRAAKSDLAVVPGVWSGADSWADVSAGGGPEAARSA